MAAAQAIRKRPRTEAKNEILLSLYKKPFVFMHNYSNDAMRIDLFRRSISIKSIEEETINCIRDNIAALGKRISGIERFEIKPVDDEEFKMNYINKVVDLSANGGVSVAHYMEERLDRTNSYPRIIRL